MNYKKKPTEEQRAQALSATVECGLRHYEALSKKYGKEFCLELRPPHHLVCVKRSAKGGRGRKALYTGASRAVNAQLERSAKHFEPIIFHVRNGKAERVSTHG
jgi:hypothetical protein